jgi:hypothetical protein
MQSNLDLMSSEELRDLFIDESERFNTGVDNGLSFTELQQLRATLRGIAVILKSRLKSAHEDGSNSGNGK